MASMTIRNIEDDTKKLLRLRAARRGASMEEEVRSILRAVATTDISVDDILRAGTREGSQEGAWASIRQLREKYGTFEFQPPERRALAGEEPVFD